MKYNRFEEVPVWLDATDMAVAIFELTEDPENATQDPNTAV